MAISNNSLIQRLGLAINYPGDISESGGDFVFVVDDIKIFAKEDAMGICLYFPLNVSQEQFPSFAEFSFGRILRENAILSRDGETSTLFIWLHIPFSAKDDQLHGSFESFVDSCEWWRSRTMEREIPASVLPDLLIRP